MAMVYLGQDRLYTFNQWSGDYSVWQYGALACPANTDGSPRT